VGRGKGEGGGEGGDYLRRVQAVCLITDLSGPQTSGSFYLNLRLLANRYKCTDVAFSGISCNFL
jgi:hypothetical protein